jgi:hypothetical protein
MSRIAVADRLSEQQVEAVEANESAAGENAVRPTLAEVVAQISADSRVAPKQYLDETVQPLGGE